MTDIPMLVPMSPHERALRRGRALRTFRMLMRLSMGDVARAAGVSVGHVSSIETGRIEDLDDSQWATWFRTVASLDAKRSLTPPRS